MKKIISVAGSVIASLSVKNREAKCCKVRNNEMEAPLINTKSKLIKFIEYCAVVLSTATLHSEASGFKLLSS